MKKKKKCEAGGYKSHQLWKEDEKEGLEDVRCRALETLDDHLEGRKTLDERGGWPPLRGK